ncbi:helix-turn-helix domain-containing protein [Asanoa iriomotensis]|uniref:Transcriptional regulator n=1 Tax=Asanoa iriomotensis TaxID=234613 RepID=A0ABQ4C9U2_9ACTN|nr:helix-turn-helix domain-containing protein [Asanoa iriomotensis]GIF59552.1 transcriptional regulator [Asanoa iriomotensis]
MLRIHFTGDDIARTRIASAADPLWELVLAMHMLRGQRGDLLFAGWRRGALAALDRAGLSGRLGLLSALTPTLGYFPDFLTPAAATRGLDHGLEAIRATPVPVLARDLRRLPTTAAVAPVVRGLARGDVDLLVGLTATMHAVHRAAIAPHQPVVEAAVRRDRAIRVTALADGGVEGMLSSLRPRMAWSAGELRVPGHRDQEIALGGRGLLLVPSYFCLHHPMTLFDPALPPVLVYPVDRTAAVAPAAGRRLAPLLGQTRAAILEAMDAGRSTTDLARLVGVSPASASEHNTVLRDAGLITSHRDRNRVVHQLTPLGRAVLAGNTARPDSPSLGAYI